LGLRRARQSAVSTCWLPIRASSTSRYPTLTQRASSFWPTGVMQC
jgi:hypothetical protein